LKRAAIVLSIILLSLYLTITLYKTPSVQNDPHPLGAQDPYTAGKISSYTARDLLAELEKKLEGVATYAFIIETESWKGAKHDKKISRLYFKKPNLLRMDVLEGSKRGSTLVLDREGRIRGRNSWGLRKTLRPTDKRIKNIRGQTFLNSSLADKLMRMKEDMLKKGCEVTVREVILEGRPSYLFHVDRDDPSDPVTDEYIWFDKETFMALKNLKFEDRDKVSETIWREIEINITLDDSLFEL